MVNIATGTVEDLRAEREKEYGTYVAAEEIRFDGVLAFGVGFPVPISHVEEYPQLVEPDENGNVAVITREEYLAREEKAASDKAAEDVVEPGPKDGRSAWVKFAAASGAPESELVRVADGGLGRDDLATKYGTPEAAE